ncbi:MAG: sugar phosphate nucleotidyltransferase [Erythrobacter sp.]
MNTITPVILCGGSGTRLWPRSRKSRPKPFINLVGEASLFAQALGRCADPSIFADPVIVAGTAHVPLIRDELDDEYPCSLLVEPIARNTAPAIALAAASLDPDAIMLVCPSDHHIADAEAFRSAASAASDLAREDWLVAFGIEPDRAETGYGYIRCGKPMGSGFAVDRFVEKPDLESAEQFLADGNYTWNGGIFAFRAGRLLEELQLHRPKMAKAVTDAMVGASKQGNALHPDAAAFAAIEGESIDYAVMENTDRAAMVPVTMGWSDIGNWASVLEAKERDQSGNSAPAKHQLAECNNVLVVSDTMRVSAVGLDDISIIVDGDDILVVSNEAAQKVGKLDGPNSQ